MSTNHDDKLLQKIERLVDNGLPINDDLLNELANHQPLPDDRHTKNLEAQLMALAYEKNTETIAMDTSKKNKNSTSKRRFRIPATFAAVLALLVLIAFFLLPTGTNPREFLFGSDPIVQSHIPTATPMGMVLPATQVLDPFAMTSTQLMIDSTDTVQNLTATAMIPPTQSIDPFALTATQLIIGATGTRQAELGEFSTATPIPTSTMTPTPTFTPTQYVSPVPSATFTATPLPIATVRLMGDDLMFAENLAGANIGTRVNIFAVIFEADVTDLDSVTNHLIQGVSAPLVSRSQSAQVNRLANGPDGSLQFVELEVHPDDMPIIEWLISSNVKLIIVAE